MSYSIDTNILLYASDESSPCHKAAKEFLANRVNDPDLCCLTWLVLMGYQRVVTHPTIFKEPLTPCEAWRNITSLLSLPRVRIIGETESFAHDYEAVTKDILVKGNLVPDAHIATILRQNGIRRIYTSDSDFRKFHFLEVINPLL